MDEDFVRDARKGKAKLEEEEEEEEEEKVQIPLPLEPIPKTYSDFGDDVVYLKIIGPSRELEAVEIDSPELKKIKFRFRNKDLLRICGNDDARINNIQTVSGATIGIFSDSASRIHRHLYLELSGTPDQVKIAELFVTDAITEDYERPYIPRALMPMNICHHAITIPFTQLPPLLGIDGVNLLKLESESGTWIEIDTYPSEALLLERVVNIYGQGLDVTNAIMMVNDRISEYDKSVQVKDDMVIEEMESGEESFEKMEAEEQKDVEGIDGGGDELGNETKEKMQ